MNYWLWFANIEGIGSIKKQRLLEKFDKNPGRIYKAIKEDLINVEGIGIRLCEKILASKDEILINKMEAYMKKNNIKQLNFYDNEYPGCLKNIYDPPITLFYKGDINLLNSKCVSIVGSRMATKYGLNTAFKIGEDCSIAGYTVVSGMARGIDTMAHKGALNKNGKTLAVVGCGLDRVYPTENANLFNEISQKGLIISEFVVGTKPEATNFPSRNRIISGLSENLIVVEAAPKSGAMITVDYALDQGKNVYAVPGNIDAYLSKGTNELIKNGAMVYTNIEDIY